MLKFNMKHPLWKTNPAQAKEGFEKELRQIMERVERPVIMISKGAPKECTECIKKISVDFMKSFLTDILGDEK